jgi:hypothetical protein
MNMRFLGAGPMNVPLFRAYACGWFKGGESHWTWVFPNGAIETETDAPVFNDILVEAANRANAQATEAAKSEVKE